MFYYTLKEGLSIEQFAEISDEQTPPAFMCEWLSTKDKIIRLHDGTLAFEKDVDLQAEQTALDAKQRQEEMYMSAPSIEERINDIEVALMELAGDM